MNGLGRIFDIDLQDQWLIAFGGFDRRIDGQQVGLLGQVVHRGNDLANRLALLQTVVKEFSTIADFSEIVTVGKESRK